ncbi:Arf-GAP with SH3 domain ANK repeat and PH domain-containing protein [Fasciola gigantica]|uniref:Arf-GAP with SH3 domain ANK repeat and PH domain-containing protein n=1 Tax=Fasciola gigantica TaxID=46835 RepID=A0A504YNJ0_FASGI|nr:Arf-GAP with SH3 domain ANK repeat and PH domain-containing protein [Fasciola gigantica]
MLQRRTFIKAKYIDRRYITSTTTTMPPSNISKGTDSGLDESSDCSVRDPLSERFLRRDLLRAVRTGNLSTLLQVYAERFDLMTPFQADDDDGLGEVAGQSALHIAVQQTRLTTSDLSPPKSEFQSSSGGSHNNLALVEFIIQNSPSASVQRTNHLGETALHHGVRHGCLDALRILLQAGGLPTPMLSLTNKAGQTALKLAEELADSSPVDNQLFKSCAELLRLAENVSTLKSGTDPAGSVCSLFPNSDTNDRVLAARSSLMEAVDQLESVDWGLTDPGSKPRLSSTCRRTASVATSDLGVTFALGGFSRSHDSSTASPKYALNSKQHTVDGDGDGPVPGTDKTGRCLSRLHSYVSQYGHALATLPRKKGPAPRPPPTEAVVACGGPLEFEAHFDNSPRDRRRLRFSKFHSSSSTISAAHIADDHRHATSKGHAHCVSTVDSPSKLNQNRSQRTTFSLVESELATEGTSPDFSSDLSCLTELMHSSLCGSGAVDHDFGACSKPTSPARVHRSLTGAQSSGQLTQKFCRSNDHIDILLDVLEEKPSSGTNSSPSKSTASVGSNPNPPPPIPPKPSVCSSVLYSTLPTRTSARNDFRLSVHRDPNTNGSESKPIPRSVLPITPRLPKPSLFPVQPSPLDRAETYSNRTLTNSSKANNQSSSHGTTDSTLDVSTSKLGDLLEAVYDCEAERSDELAFRQGELIQLAARPDDDWWEGFIASEPWRRGMFPVTYVKRHAVN